MPVSDRLGDYQVTIDAPRAMSRRRSPHLTDLVRHYRDRLLRESNLEQLVNLPHEALRAHVESRVARMLQDDSRLISSEDRLELVSSILDETVGYGPLQPLLADPTITEIMVNRPDEVYVEVEGQRDMVLRRDIYFDSEEHIRHVIDRIISPLGRRIDESSPMVDARLPDGSRVHAIIPPLAVDGPLLNIRRFRKRPFSLSDLEGNLTLCPQMGRFLACCVVAKLNILVSGGTGSGKTTTLNVLSSFIPHNERIVTIEDAAELRFFEQHAHVARLEARPPNVEGKGEITIRQLVRTSLRMRPNRIVVGEVRGPEALDMLQAMNTGHEGSLTTIHANSSRDAFSRLETMVLQGGLGIPIEAIRSQVIAALNIVVQQDRLVDNNRRMTAISEVLDVDAQGNILLEDVFRFKQTGITDSRRVRGFFCATGYRPRCLERMRAYGVAVDDALFDPEWRIEV